MTERDIVEQLRERVEALTRENRRLSNAVEAAGWAKTRLEDYYRSVRAGTMDGGDRELERRVWAAFAQFDVERETLAIQTPDRND